MVSARQWTIIAVLVIAFGGAALVVAGTGSDNSSTDPGSDFDEVAWCRAVGAVGERSVVLDPGFGGDPLSATTNLLAELEAAIGAASPAAAPDVARLHDFTLLVGESLTAGSTLQGSLLEAVTFTDTARVDEAVARISAELERCGRDPLAIAVDGIGGS